MEDFARVGLPDHAPESIGLTTVLTRLPEVFRKSRQYVDNQWSRECVRSVQTQRLRRLLVHALETVPWYRGCGVSVADVEADPHAALRRFPLVEKRQLQAQMLDFVTDALVAERAFKVTTSGSTGIPLTIVDDHDSLVEYAASYHRTLAAYGLEPGVRLANVIADAERPTRTLEAQLLVGACEIARENLLDSDSRLRDEALDFLASWRPTAVFGNPSDLVLLAIRLRALGRSLPTVRAILSCGENLTPSMRETVESVMQLRVTEMYSMQECKAVAWACPEGKLHVNDDRVVVESIPHSSGDREIVITHLCNLSMPLIRYKTSDVGVLADPENGVCECGRALSTLEGFQGRDRGFLVTPDGRWFSPRAIKLFLTELPLITWRLVQDEPRSVRLEISPRNPKSTAELCAVVHEQLSSIVDNCLEIHVEAVEAEELLAKPGKFQMMRLNAYQAM